MCSRQYNEDDRTPRTLACGHTFCTLCIINGISAAEITCPLCQRLHHAVGPRDIPVSLSLLRVVRTAATPGRLMIIISLF
ncbi:hypothetical protein SK128_018361 [Halocaridina rubra]|uniref:RING-type domain-containing protein n=1 Tax=Halocaridina rubra TaxID=373956 RepID=A0AAN9A4U1_HALRR